MRHFNLLSFLALVLVGFAASGSGDNYSAPSHPALIIPDCLATGYFCVYDSELDGSQTLTPTISNGSFDLKASFLFGGYGVAMQGTGKTAPNGNYIKYTGGGGTFVYISGPDAGRNLEGQWVVNPKTLRNRYARLGITDFAGFGNLALAYPGDATYSHVTSIAGSTGQPLIPWHSIAVDPSLIPVGQTCKLSFKNGTYVSYENFRTQDVGPMIKGRRIDIYLGEGRAALNKWLQSGGNRFVDVYILPETPLETHLQNP